MLFYKRNPNLTVEIGSHTDSRGTEKMNNNLSSMRARNIWNYLVKEIGIDSTKIKYRGYGSSQLINKDEQILKAKTKLEKEILHSVNRRTELKVIEIK